MVTLSKRGIAAAMGFTNFEGKPVTRLAYEIKHTDVITYLSEKSEASVGELSFKCYEEPKHGDYIVYLTETDTYHVSRAVFHERNVIPD